MDCKRVRELMAEYVDGRLGAAAAGPLRAHVEECSACRREQALLEGTWNLLLQYPEIEADVLARVRRKIHNPWSRFLRVAGSVAAAAAVLLAVVVFVSGPADPVAAEVSKLAPADRELLDELAKPENRDLLENMDVIKALEMLGADRAEGRDPWNGH